MSRGLWIGLSGLLLVGRATTAREAAEVSLVSRRRAYTVAESVSFAVRATDADRAAGNTLVLRHADGSSVTINVPPETGSRGSRSRIVTVNAFVLKPGEYSASVGPGNAEGLNVYPDEHKNAYFTGQWTHHGRTVGNILAKGGWMFMNGDYSNWGSDAKGRAQADSYVAARMKPYWLTVLGGGHQLDLGLVNDWGDPWVQRTIVWRMTLSALGQRIHPIRGLHCFDEPGLTWWPVEGKGLNPFVVPHQLEEFRRLTGFRLPNGGFLDTAPGYATMMEEWVGFLDMRMKYLEQAWSATAWSTEAVHPAFETVNQVSSSYSPGNVTDGIDGRQARPYRIVSGHGGYSDLPFGTFQPIRSCEAMQSFSRGRPHIYLPMWYVHTWASIRNAVFASWLTKLEGMLYTPEQDLALDFGKFGFHGTNTVFEIAEINRRLALVGGVMNQLAKTPSPVAVLWSHRQAAHDIATVNHPEVAEGVGAPMYASAHTTEVNNCFWRLLETGIVPNWIDEEEAIQGAPGFLSQWKVIFCPGLAYAAPAFREILEGYTGRGGRLVQFTGDGLRIAGAIRADYEKELRPPQLHEGGLPQRIDALRRAKDPAWMRANSDLNWREWAGGFAPTFAEDLRGWLGERPCRSENPDVLLAAHRAGEAVYILMANNAQSEENPRGVKHELVAATTEVRVPGGGVVYDLFNGGEVAVREGRARLELAAGDGACWLHLPGPPGEMRLAAGAAEGGRGPALDVKVTWGTEGFLPFRLRIYDPAGKEMDDLYRATTPGRGRTVFQRRHPLGVNASPGAWTVEVHEWLTGGTVKASVAVQPASSGSFASVEKGPVSIFFDDAEKIRDLFAGRAAEPPYEKLNWDSKRVFGLDRRRFAVFGSAPQADRIASALRAGGMTVEVNPPCQIEPLVREKDRGGAGPRFRGQGMTENVRAHTVVLPGHDLAKKSVKRGFINYPVTAAFPGPGRAYIQWGMSCFQPGWQNVFVLGDAEAGTAWLLGAIEGRVDAGQTALAAASVTSRRVEVQRTAPAKRFAVRREIRLHDTPVGVDRGRSASAAGEVTYVLLYDGSVTAYDRSGRALWETRALMEGWDLSLSPRGDRLAAGGYPGLMILDAADGNVLGGYRAGPQESEALGATSFVGRVAWNDSGTLAAGGWSNGDDFPDKVVLVDSGGRRLPGPENVPGSVMGVRFVPGSQSGTGGAARRLPGTNTLLFGAEKLMAFGLLSRRRGAPTAELLWTNDIKLASSFAFADDGRTAAAGGWGRSAGVFSLTDGRVLSRAEFDAVVGGVALTPKGDLVVAVWGGTHPLYRLPAGTAPGTQAAPLFQSRFGFQNVLWSRALGGLVAAE